MNISKIKIALFSGLTFLLTFGLYVWTHSPTLISCGDSAELVTVAHTLGVAHAPGYPLFTLTGKIFSTLLNGTPAARLHIATGFFMSLACVNLFLFLLFSTKRVVAALAGALMFGYSYHGWLYAHVPEVTALAIFLISLFILGMFLWWDSGENRWIYFSSFILGLCWSHHHMIVLLMPGVLYFVWKNPRKFNLLHAFLFFLLGLTPYIYVLIRAHHMPFMNSGVVTDLSRFIDHFTRKNYGTVTLTTQFPVLTSENAVLILKFFFQSLVKSYLMVGVLIGVLGWTMCWKKLKTLFVFLVASFAIAGPVFMLIAKMPPASVILVAILERFLILSFFIFSIGIGFGFQKIAEFLERLFTPKSGAIASIALLVLPGINVARNYSDLNFSGFKLNEIYGRDAMSSMNKNALVIIKGDNPLFTLTYLQQAEGLRTDLNLVNYNQGMPSEENTRHHFKHLNLPPSGFQLTAKTLVQFNVKKRDVYVVGVPGNLFRTNGWSGNPYFLIPNGLNFKIETAPLKALDDDVWNAFKINTHPNSPNRHNAFVEETYHTYATAAYNKAALSKVRGHEKITRAAAQKALTFDPSFKPAKELLKQL